MRKDSGVDGDAQRIGQLSWMLFLKIFSDSEENWSFYEEGYESPIPAELQWSAWASDDEGITGDELLDFVNNKLFPTLKNLPTEGNKRAYMIRSIFEDAFNYMKSGQLLRQIINKINERSKVNDTVGPLILDKKPFMFCSSYAFRILSKTCFQIGRAHV